MFPRKGAIALVTTALALVLLISFKTPDATVSGSRTAASSGSGTGANSIAAGGTSSSTSTSGGSSAATATPSTGSATAGTITGSMVQTRFGPVQVQITVSGGKVTNVQAVQLPSGGRSGQISNYVEPMLASEALQAQSANIDIISGATYTSEAYARSLQSALDQAGIASVEVAA